VAEDAAKPKDPPQLHIGPLTSASRIRCAFTRLANAVLRGRIRPEVSNAAAYCIAGASKALELELLEKGFRELARRNELRERELRYFDAQVANATQGVPTAQTSALVPVNDNGHDQEKAA
jgi:hypothetical protein